jgi:hypothetical protein
MFHNHLLLASGAFSPIALFASGEQGAWYDPSDFSTLFQNSSGTTPVTAVEQPVGLVLDKSGNGNHASQSSDASRPVLRARYNQFLNSATLSTQNVTTVVTNYTLRFDGAGSVTLSGTGSGTYNAGSHTVTCTAGTLTVTVTGTVTNADIRVANDGVGLPAYQAITTATSYDTVGFPPYLQFDGSDDSLATAAIDFSATDEMTVVAGVRKLSDAAFGMVLEFGNRTLTINGDYYLGVPTGGKYEWSSRGTTSVFATSDAASFVAPVTNVVAAFSDISADIATLRVNGNQAATVATDQGTGNFENRVLNIGSRGGSSLRYNGRLYSLIVRGKTSTADEITAAETWVNGKTGAY